MQKTCLSCEASHIDESYASPSHNGKKSCVLPIGREGKAKKLFFAAPSLGCAHLGPIKALWTSQLVPNSFIDPKVAHPRDDTVETNCVACPSTPLGKRHDFLPL